MGIQNSTLPDKSSASGPKSASVTVQTEAYITDLLSDLQRIAKIGGLSNLSDDIGDVLSKYGSNSIAT